MLEGDWDAKSCLTLVYLPIIFLCPFCFYIIHYVLNFCPLTARITKFTIENYHVSNWLSKEISKRETENITPSSKAVQSHPLLCPGSGNISCERKHFKLLNHELLKGLSELCTRFIGSDMHVCSVKMEFLLASVRQGSVTGSWHLSHIK